MNTKRINIFREKHIGLGFRWDRWNYPLELSFSFPFTTITVGIGKAL